MNILSTQYTLNRRSFEIYVAGCKGNPHCFNCHNQESWSFLQGDKYNEEYFKRIKTKVKNFDNLIDSIELFGGELLDQNYNDLEQFLKDIKTLNKPIWLFTRFDLKEVPNFVKEYCDYIKCGRYVEELSCDNNIKYGIKLSTSNQTIYKKGVDY
jgi:pyruvate-formate lyase-activating enzyme